MWFKKWCCNSNVKGRKQSTFDSLLGHSLNLACSDTMKQCQIIRNSLDDSVLEKQN